MFNLGLQVPRQGSMSIREIDVETKSLLVYRQGIEGIGLSMILGTNLTLSGKAKAALRSIMSCSSQRLQCVLNSCNRI